MVCVGITSLETTIWEAIRTKEEHNHPKTLYFPTFFNAWQLHQNSVAYMYETNKGDYIMALEGVYTKEFVYEEFNKLKNNKEKVKLYGSGRTDSKVHAIEQSAHFDVKNKINNIKKFFNTLNYFLNGKFITVVKIKKRPLTFHARYSAKKRIYKYLIHNRESLPSINRDRGWYVRKKLDSFCIKYSTLFELKPCR